MSRVPRSNLRRGRPPPGEGLTVGKSMANYGRFIAEPDRLVAAIAADWMDEWKEQNPKWRPPQKVLREADGAMVSLYEAATDHAVDLDQNWWPERFPKEAPPVGYTKDHDFKDGVKELLRLGRTSWPGES
jgi:hypothetical protein